MKKIAASLKTILKVSWLSLAIPTTLLVCTESAAFVYHSARQLMVGDQLSTYVRVQAAKMPRDGYASPPDQSWFAAYWKEFNDSTYASIDWASYSNYHRHPFQGRYINVDRSGRRVTWNQNPTGAGGMIRLGIFGGSTIWGTGARDEFTIPSYVSKLLAARYPHRFAVINYGQDRYVNTQEVITLLREIQIDRAPEIAVFYDGYNDVFAAIQSGIAGIPMNEDDRLREFNILHPSRARDFYFEASSRTGSFQLIQRLQAALRPEAVADSPQHKNPDALANDVVGVYSCNIEFVSAIAKEGGRMAQFYWEPSVYSKSSLTGPEKSILRSSDHIAAFYRQVQAVVRHRVANRSNFRDISGALDGYATTAFIDTHNVTELANEMIAREIVADLKDSLDRAVSRASVEPALTDSNTAGPTNSH